ncbi:serine/threonine-protein phosphatase [Kitasatospora sp. GP82]|uniref:ATP-binding SpoIIE family protein phosphatase n=1 Tax=Kitasatospora sp. GP82 TaxID=3035089 RepID=UPI00247720DF|nr:serine/threonine-protein phosphatase [Kitasatospora sp. GP82]MDH6124730.1 serine phosphatase RsbU (regulator of sigma subunit)/anti-sigma regulatory factor (Ser/Thr protein kinase) [Kitasatospora sp. GP82]
MLPEVELRDPKHAQVSADEGASADQAAQYREAAQRSARLAFAHDAMSKIGTTLDLDQTIKELSEVAVPLFADFASIHLHDRVTALEDSSSHIPKGSVVLRRVAVAHEGDRHRWDSLRTGDAFVYLADTPMTQFLTVGEPILIPQVTEESLRQLPEQLDTPATRQLLLDSSLLVLPLAARGAVLGFLALVRGPDRHAFDSTDMTAARELAARAALCVDNARLYTREVRAATALQRSMLPNALPQLPGVEIAYRYLPGSDAAQVGGDWFDAIPLPGRRVALVVGDVMGHGLRSAAVMGQLRTAVQTLADLDLPPAQLLTHLDHLTQRLGDAHLATCLYCVYDPVGRSCTIANAGHVPPVLVHPDGRSELLELPSGVPIGVGGVAFDSVELPVADGSLLVLCTDGLVETRNQDIEVGLAALQRSLVSLAPSLDENCEALLRGQQADDRRDDIALLMARFHGIPPGNVATWTFPAQAAQVRSARALVRETLVAWGLHELSDVTQLLVSELITNAVRHSSGPVGLRLVRTDVLLCEVTDDHPAPPALARPSDTDEHGRGIRLVNQLSSQWGCIRRAARKTVWFEL